MTRKKSNVKALALAVTCAILAGGYSGLNPVYAADKLYKDGGDVTTSTTTTEITELEVGGVTIGGSGNISGTSITLSGASTFSGATTFSGTATFGGQSTFNAGILTNTIGEATSGNGVTVGGVKFSNNNINTNGEITTSKLVLSNGMHNISDVGEAIDTNSAGLKALNDTVGDATKGLVKKVADNETAIQANATDIATKADQTALDTANGKITALEGKTTNLDDDGKTLTNMTKVSAATLAVGDKEITAAKVDSYDAAVSKTANITQNTDGSTTVDGVKFKAGAVSGVTSINDGIKISNDGGTVTFNKDNPTGQVEISATGIKVGTGSAYINNDGFKAGADGKNSLTTSGLTATTINAGTNNTEFTVDKDGNTNVGGTLKVTGDTTLKGKLDVTGNITGADITSTGALKGKTLGIGTNGTEFTVDADGAVKAAGGKVEIDKTGKAIFGDTAGGITTIEGKKIITGSIVANDTTVESTISGVKMKNGLITADSMKITGAIDLDNLKVNNKLTVGTFSVDNTGVVTGLTSINDVAVAKNGTGLKIGSATVGDANPFKSNGFTVDATGNIDAKDITAGTYNGNTIGTDNTFNGVELKGGNVAATQVTANTITDGIATMTGGKVTANEITANTSATLAGVKFDASGVDFNNKEIKNIAKVSATTADLGKLHIEGSKITNVIDPGGGIGLGTNVTVNDAGELGGITKIDGVNVTDNAGGLAIGTGATQVTIGGANAISVGTGAFTVDGAGLVTGNQFTTTNGSYLKDNELKLNAANIWNTTEGIKAEKAVIGANTLNAAGISTTGTLDVKGQATFGNSTSGNYTTVNGGKVDITANGGTTTIEGAKITTKTLDVEDIILRNEMKDGTGATINIKGSDGSMSVAGGKFKVDANGQVTNHITATGAAAADTIFTTSETGIDATFQKNGEAASSGLKIDHNHAALNASGGAALDLKDKTATLGIGTDSLTTYTSDTIESKVGADASRTLKADEIVDKVGSTTVTTKSGGTTFSDGTTNTLINGSAITSTNGAAAGVLDGSNLTLTNGANSTALSAGSATFTGADGRSDATGVKNQTTIDGGIITTDTLNVQRIELGDKLVDSNGTSHGSNLSMDEYGNIKAAGGKFTVAGTNQTNPGALHNEVGGKTFLDTTETGASMKFDNTAATDGVKSEVSVEANKATVAAGDKASFVANTDNGGTATITGGTQTVTTTDAGTVFKNSAHKDPFGGGIVTETTINGNEITTGKITTDQLVIKGNGSGAAAGAGSGSIALGGNGSITSNIQDATTGKEATFKTDETGTFTEAKDSAGNKTTNTVNAQGNTNKVADGTNTSTATQTATSIGGVVTNGTVTMKQELTADGLKLEQTGYDEVNIAKGDVTVKNNRNTATPNQEVHLSDLGSLNNLDGELAARDKYQDNKTAVGAINAEAAIRREEVARLDNRIDDVNNRVDKVGAMAAAIASLKSIGYDPQAPSEFSIGLGQYKGETGVAMGFFHYPNKNFMINVSLSTAGGETMGGIGATWRFGHKSPQKLLEEQREAQARKELAAAEKYQAAAKLAKEAQERAEYAAKLARQAQVSADNAKAAADATQAKHFQ
ncbi:YadA-like family protein [uncultured Phascolarctobacterium sp.]|uniref:YadA-like family protein n=1 Tax=uncultured Phascolarctobacterium sp. TaxID=512296 RepID=UPI0025EFD04F|nr:YadA-like family protein [uncultured Phascolarctobacterium sp.]